MKCLMLKQVNIGTTFHNITDAEPQPNKTRGNEGPGLVIPSQVFHAMENEQKQRMAREKGGRRRYCSLWMDRRWWRRLLEFTHGIIFDLLEASNPLPIFTHVLYINQHKNSPTYFTHNISKANNELGWFGEEPAV